MILGAGESGLGAAMLAKQQGYRPTLLEEGALTALAEETLSKWQVPVQAHRPQPAELAAYPWLIKSPGIPQWHSTVQAARQQGVDVIGEIEFASWFTTGSIIGVTGTNGKTTTVNLLTEMLGSAELDVGLAGNTGASFARQLTQQDHAFWVLELSSFQLEDVDALHCTVSILLNITPDHLNRYPGGMAEYAEAKFRITANQHAGDAFIYNQDDFYTQSYRSAYANAQVSSLPFSQDQTIPTGASIQNETAYLAKNAEQAPAAVALPKTTFSGQHERQNLLAAAMAAHQLGVSAKIIGQALQHFKGVPHRMEPVNGPGGVTFINDSKGSNLDATYHALVSTAAPIVWIAGGLDKGNDYTILRPLVAAKVHHLVALGMDTEPLFRAFQDQIPITSTTSMPDAVRQAYSTAVSGDTILLSPACASFDLFQDFADRGDQFKEAVKLLIQTSETSLPD